MFYANIPQSEALDKAIELAEGSQIDVQAISNIVMITFRQPLWMQLMEGSFLMMDMAIFSMFKLHEAAKLPVVALFPCNFCLRMDADKSREYKKNPYKFVAGVTKAMMAVIACNFSNCDPHYFL